LRFVVAYDELQGAAATACYHCSMPSARRFPPPWMIEEQEACFTVRDENGQTLAYVYFEEEPVSHRSRFGPGVKLRGLVCRRGRSGSSCWRFVLQGRLFHCLGDGLLCGRTSRGQIFIWGERNQDGCWRVRRARDHYTKQQHERGNEPHARTGFI
jgi:hypothetical protein